MKISFRNDYSDVGHPDVLKVLLDNVGKYYTGYGADIVTERLTNKLRELTKENIDIYVLSGGTQTNLTLISKGLADYEAVVCVESGHINVHETGAVETTGHKIITTKGSEGKILPNEIEEIMFNHTENYMVKPKMVYISNSTEIGTIYTLKELKAIYEICKKYDLFLFMDGARLPVALTAEGNDLDLTLITKYTDAYYLGGTKNGMPYGELLVIKDPFLKKDFFYHLKNKGSMLSKSFVLSLMFEKMLTDDFYLLLAKNTNYTATFLRNEIKKLSNKEIEIKYENPTNQIFLTLNNKLIDKLNEQFIFELWEKGPVTSVIRLVTSWMTTVGDCEAFIKEIKNYKQIDK